MPYDIEKDVWLGKSFKIGMAARYSRNITPSDTTDLDPYAPSLLVLSGGDLVILPVENVDDDTITLTDLPAGAYVLVQVRRVYSTGTSASVATLEPEKPE